MTQHSSHVSSLSRRGLVLLAGAGSAATLAGALVFQAMGYAPCHLCILQRWPHVAAVVIAIAMLLMRLPGVTALLGALAALSTAGIGVYHSLVERKLIEGPTSCTSGGVGTLSVDDLMAQIESAPLIRCDEIPWEMFGLTMANLNAILSLGLAVIWVMAFRATRR